jgi:hypothetical protein
MEQAGSLKVHGGKADIDHFFYILFNSLLILQYHLTRRKRKVTQPILDYLLKAVREHFFWIHRKSIHDCDETSAEAAQVRRFYNRLVSITFQHAFLIE